VTYRDRRLVSALIALCAAACSEPALETELDYDADATVDSYGFEAATPATARVNAALDAALDPDDDHDFELAQRGLIAREAGLEIRTDDGQVIWRPADFAFLDDGDVASIDPSLARQARLNGIHGLFEVRPGIYQVRGYDLANMSLIAGNTGWIIIDPLTSVETARAALDLANRELGERPISAIIFTHSHIDHFGGVAGIVDPDALGDGEVTLIAPAGFTEAAVSENVLAGVVMGRRAAYMYGTQLPRTPRGHVGSGLGKHPALGTHTIAAPNLWVTETGQRETIDGIRMEFQYAPETEAPAELTVFLPDLNAWCGAELVSRTMHNLYTLRGTQVRDALAWSDAIDDALTRYGDETEVVFNSHHWPVWGQDEIRDYLSAQRDVYKFIHDQTLRLAAQGLGPDEIAETIRLPESLAGTYSVRGYYGTLKHNARAVYQRYFGWYDGVPANLDPHARGERARLYVAALGGMDVLLEQAETAFQGGDYRWSAELGQHAVFAAPDHAAARDLLARSYEQLGYQAESAPWRDVYLTGAWELRHEIEVTDVDSAGAEILQSIPLDMFFAAMATRIDPEKAAEHDRVFNFQFTDVGETYVIEISNGVMRHRAGGRAETADANVTLTRAFWLRLLQRDAGLAEMITSREFAIDGDRAALLGFFAMLDQPQADFDIVTP
jgi:alkyl sulfatase BDS1-like metallo-beta-lactamase superfamily hydrolase